MSKHWTLGKFIALKTQPVTLLEKRKSKVEIMINLIKLNDDIPVCVAATVDDLQIFKLQISDSMSNYLTSVVQHLKRG